VIYMIEVFLVVSIPIFVLAGTVLLGLIAWTQLKDYARARLAMHRIAHGADRERLEMSPTSLQRRPAESLRVA
jgi:hypothetical protein